MNPQQKEHQQALLRSLALKSPDAPLDRITRLTARLFKVPIAIVTVVENDRVGIISACGLEGIHEVPRSAAFSSVVVDQDAPLIVPDASTDPKWLSVPQRECGLRFYAGVPLRSKQGFNLGTLCLGDEKPRSFSSDELAQLQEIAGVIIDELELRITNREETERKDAFFAELHHRIKNNLQVISSLLALHRRRVTSHEAKQALKDFAVRVDALAFLQAHFYKEHEAEVIDVVDYLRDLAARIVDAYDARGHMTTRVDGPTVELSIEKLGPITFIATEIIANACNHTSLQAGHIRIQIAFASSQLRVTINTTEQKTDYAQADYMRMLARVANSIDANVILRSEANGVELTLGMPMSDAAAD